MDRLHLIAPDLVPLLAAASRDQRRRSAYAVARWVVEHVEHLPAEIVVGLDGSPPSQLNQIAERLDDDYLSLQEQVEAGDRSNDGVTAAFSRARAAHCVALAASGEASECIYEAVAATDNLAGVRTVVLKSFNAA